MRDERYGNDWPSAFTIVGLGLCAVLVVGALTQCVSQSTKDSMDYRIACVQAGNLHTEKGCVPKEDNSQIVKELNEFLEKNK